MASLARGLGVAVGGLYRYFPSKTHVIAALQVEALMKLESFVVEQLAAVEAAVVARATGESVASLAAVMAAPLCYLRHARQSPDWHHLIDQSLSAAEPLLDDETAAEVAQALGAVLRPVTERLQAAADLGHLDAGDAEARTYTLWAAIHGLDHMRKRDVRVREGLRSDALTRGALRALLVGWGADAQVAEASFQLADEALSEPVAKLEDRP